MNIVRKRPWLLPIGLIAMALAMMVVGCSAGRAQEELAGFDATSGQDEHDHETGAKILALPELAAAELDGETLRVIATTSIIGDVVTQVGGQAIQLTTLMGPGQDPHSYEPGAQELTAVAEAHVIFVNGWDLEEGLASDLAEIGKNVPIVAISADIAPISFVDSQKARDEKAEDEHRHDGAADPHVWFSIHNVEQWVKNVEQVLGDLDPANAETYESNAAAYLVQLEALREDIESQLAQIPKERRFLVTNHDSFSYFARDYGFELVGTIIPAASTLAEPSASDLAGLIEEMEAHGLCSIFTETTVGDKLAQTITAELDGCDEIQVLQLYSGAVGPAGSGADSYIGMYRANVDAIVDGLR